VSRFLLDTSIISHSIRDPRGPIFERIWQVGEERVYTSVVVAAELRFGAEKLRSTRLTAEIERRLARMPVEPFAEPCDRIYAEIRAKLEHIGMPIGANDLWIAAQALHDGSVLVTDNRREFGRVPKLKVENWLRD
jgi:tRNA(fMet)-specific endonuclease VapC